jgi:hypothetical protein
MRKDYATQNEDVSLVLGVHPDLRPVIQQLEEVLPEDEFSRYMHCWAANVLEYADADDPATLLTLELAQKTAVVRFRASLQNRGRARRPRNLQPD